MKTFIICFLFLIALVEACKSQASQQTSNEKIVKAYFSGWVAKDWGVVPSHLAEGFTFTSAAPDDHLPIEKFKTKCWPQAAYIDHFEFPRLTSSGNETFAIVHVITTDKRIIRNVEYFVFENGKIKSIEVFFGGDGKGFPTKAMSSDQ